MSESTQTLEQFANRDYEWGFVTDVEADSAPPGLNEEIIRFDCHDKPGHWHGGGYDRSGSPGNSHRDFPQGVVAVADQVDWSLQQVSGRAAELLSEADHSEAAESVDAAMLQEAVGLIRGHLEQQGDLRGQAISSGIIDA